MKHLFFVVFIIGIPFCNIAQSDNGIETWLDYYHHHKVSGKLELYGDVGFRFESLGSSDQGWWRTHVRPSIAYRFKANYDLRGGIAAIYNDNTKNTNPSYFELRPWQGTKVYWPNIKKLRFEHYFRLEEHFIFYNDESNNSFTFKGRYQLSTKIPIKKSSISKDTYFIPLSAEVFVGLFEGTGNYRNDKYRVSGGFGYRSKNFTDFLLRAVFQGSPTSDGHEAVIRFTVKQQLKF